MKQYLVMASEMKRYDTNTIEQIGILSLVLMERAALVTVEELQRIYGERRARVLVVAGCGNNGGDGFAIGRLLMLQGYCVEFVLIGERARCSRETAAQIEILSKYGMSVKDAIDGAEYDIVIDALFGIGLSREVTGLYAETIERINRMESFVCSVDIPSGVCADDGSILGCAVRADMTVTYGFYKLGQMLYDGAVYCGRVICREMGINDKSFLGDVPGWYTLREETGETLLPGRDACGNKGTFGKVLVIAGSSQVCGAAVLAAESAFRMGAGMIKTVTAEENRNILLQAVPESMILTYDDPGNGTENGIGKETDDEIQRDAEFEAALSEAFDWADVILIGPGIGVGRQAEMLLGKCLTESKLPMVIDADGLNLIAEKPYLQELLERAGTGGRTIVLTPHLGEFARLYGCTVRQVKDHMLQYPMELAKRMQAVVVCKDARTVVTAPGAKAHYLNTTGNDGMATAGSGDVLAGMIAGLLAQNMSGMEAAVCGVYLHGAAGDLAAQKKTRRSMMATDIIEQISHVMEKRAKEC
ncbi:MAG: NAD(P)H-hydrate dehydratase [Lachnospiraceae bacterium]|nr:NAD(P)H-hydrate dehydratase [Lachnospiraceae bacterium]